MLLWKRVSDLTVTRFLRRPGRRRIIPVCGNAKVGATAGWVIAAGTDKMHATLPASQTASTLVIPIEGLFIGDRIKALWAGGQVESAGNNAAATISFRKQTNAAADNVDAEIASKATGNIAADAVLSRDNAGMTCDEPVVEGVAYYILVTATTAASTDIDLTHFVIEVDQN